MPIRSNSNLIKWNHFLRSPAAVILIDVPFTTLILQIVENCEEDRPPRHAVRIP